MQPDDNIRNGLMLTDRGDAVAPGSNVAVMATEAAFYTYCRDRSENIVLLPRPISGQFNALGRWLHDRSPYSQTRVHGGTHFIETRYPVETLRGLRDDPGMLWRDELDLILGDMQTMQNRVRARAELRVVGAEGYSPGTYDFHEDLGDAYRATFHADDRVMCCYNGPTTEWIRGKDAVALPRGTNLPTYRKEDGAPAFRFRIGDLWRQACAAGRAEALIHRAVEIGPNDPPRLLVVC
ncbi:MAG: hypothetical protein HYU57_06490 [Micavibrio aeruginosavorus]|nr:hypothetical protein [Micavibrio aeruginosavorus]